MVNSAADNGIIEDTELNSIAILNLLNNFIIDSLLLIGFKIERVLEYKQMPLPTCAKSHELNNLIVLVG